MDTKIGRRGSGVQRAGGNLDRFGHICDAGARLVKVGRADNLAAEIQHSHAFRATLLSYMFLFCSTLSNGQRTRFARRFGRALRRLV
jgi:hypothetical protein